jgi:hypothetical protein
VIASFLHSGSLSLVKFNNVVVVEGEGKEKRMEKGFGIFAAKKNSKNTSIVLYSPHLVYTPVRPPVKPRIMINIFS